MRIGHESGCCPFEKSPMCINYKYGMHPWEDPIIFRRHKRLVLKPSVSWKRRPASLVTTWDLVGRQWTFKNQEVVGNSWNVATLLTSKPSINYITWPLTIQYLSSITQVGDTKTNWIWHITFCLKKCLKNPDDFLIPRLFFLWHRPVVQDPSASTWMWSQHSTTCAARELDPLSFQFPTSREAERIGLQPAFLSGEQKIAWGQKKQLVKLWLKKKLLFFFPEGLDWIFKYFSNSNQKCIADMFTRCWFNMWYQGETKISSIPWAFWHSYWHSPWDETFVNHHGMKRSFPSPSPWGGFPVAWVRPGRPQ